MTVARAKYLRKNSTDAERLLWRELRSRQLAGHKFRRQQPLGRFIVDFVCLEERLVVEVDGGQHRDATHSKYDAERDAWLAKEGFRVLRFWDHQVLREIEAVKATIWRALGNQ
jgi:very-short-patch-repair endonuclease